jgi:hypothetical protein
MRDSLKNKLKGRFRSKLGYKPDFDNPKSFQEKMCWKMINDRNPLLTLTADKLRVYDYVAEKGLPDILIPLLFSGETPEEIPFHLLPESYVCKTNGGSGGMVMVEKDKMKKKYGGYSKLDIASIVSILQAYLGRVYNHGLEWCYNDIVPAVLVQEHLGDLPAIKFYACRGEVDYLYYEDISDGHKITIYDKDWNVVPVRYDKFRLCEEVPEPKNFKEMLRVAKILGEDFDFVRVDLYNVDGKIYFGELTHYPTAGLTKFVPDDFSYEIAKDWKPR